MVYFGKNVKTKADDNVLPYILQCDLSTHTDSDTQSGAALPLWDGKHVGYAALLADHVPNSYN